MNKKIKEIELDFENMDLVRIPAETIDELIFHGSSVRKITLNDGSILKTRKPEGVVVLLNANAKQKVEGLDWLDNVFERIRLYGDILNITVFYEDGAEEQFKMPWYDAEEDTNRYQNSMEIFDKMLLVVGEEIDFSEEMSRVEEKYGHNN